MCQSGRRNISKTVRSGRMASRSRNRSPKPGNDPATFPNPSVYDISMAFYPASYNQLTMKFWLNVFALVALSLPLLGQVPPPAQSNPSTQEQNQQDDSIATFRSNLNLLYVFATVTEPNGAPIA